MLQSGFLFFLAISVRVELKLNPYASAQVLINLGFQINVYDRGIVIIEIDGVQKSLE